METPFSYNDVSQLTTRSQNIINDIGGIEKLLDHYKRFRNFLSLPKSGSFTNKELCEFCNYLLSTKSQAKEQKLVEITAQVDLIDNRSMTIYENEKPFLSVRVRNVLERLENEHNFHENTQFRTAYIKRLFLENFDYATLRNLGIKSILELQELKRKINDANYFVENSLPDQQNFVQDKFVFSLLTIFPFRFTDDELNELALDGKYSFKKLLCLFLLNGHYTGERNREVLKNLFFTHTPLDRKSLAHKIPLTPERVRQIEHQLSESIIPNAIKYIKDNVTGEPLDVYAVSGKTVIELSSFPEFSFRNFLITPNTSLTKLVYNQLYSDYVLCESLLNAKFKCFQSPATSFLILESFVTETHLKDLLIWSDAQIFSFETIGFEYRLDILIKRYYEEHNLLISSSHLNDLSFILRRIKKDIIEQESELQVKKIAKKKKQEDIINQVYLFLKQKNQGQTTKAILQFLHQHNIETSKPAFLRLINRHRSTFSSVGLGYWTLKEWEHEGKKAGGNLRNIIKNLLSESSAPLHISELHSHINEMKPVSLHSLSSNLKSTPPGTFKFFNCSYIGLEEKQYGTYWHNIPRYKPVLLNRFAVSNNSLEENLERINFLAKKYGYPETHLRFILDCRSGKYY